MKNIELLFVKNNTTYFDKRIKKKLKYSGKRKSWEYPISVDIFGGDQILEIIAVINYLDKTYNQKMPITFICSNFEFYDKLVYIILECICYYLIEIKKQKIHVIIRAKHTIWSEGIAFSPLLYLSDPRKYVEHFNGGLSGRHYRKIISVTPTDRGADLSKMMQDISCFLINNGVSEKSSSDLAEVLVELVGNAREHAKSDTLIDIDLTMSTYAKENDNNIYYGMNTAIINFSPVVFSAPLKEKIESELILPPKYDYVKEAYNYHKDFFDNNYFESDFYTISSFQDRISGSMTKKMGGRGLTTLISSLEEQADTHLCYMLSGNTILFLIKELLNYDDKELVGFNLHANYLSELPDERVIERIQTMLPGTAYNLSFAIRREWSL